MFSFYLELKTQRVILALKFNLGCDVEYKCEAKFIGISKQSIV
jgi:hypothetical protein